MKSSDFSACTTRFRSDICCAKLSTMNQAARTGYGLSCSIALHASIGSSTVNISVPFGAHQLPRSNAVVVRPPAKVVTPPPWTPMFPVSACSVSSACIVRSPRYQCESAKPARTPTG